MFTNKLYPILQAFFNSRGYVFLSQDSYKLKIEVLKKKAYKEGYEQRIVDEMVKKTLQV